MRPVVHGATGYEEWGLPAEEDDVVEWKPTSLREAGTDRRGAAGDPPGRVGNRTGLFGSLREPLRLDLVGSRSFPSGTVIHAYRPHEGTR